MNTQLKSEIRGFIVDNFLFGEDRDTLTENQSLVEAGLIDSLGIAELVAFVETQFGIEPTDDELVPENFDSIALIAAFVERKLPVPAE